MSDITPAESLDSVNETTQLITDEESTTPRSSSSHIENEHEIFTLESIKRLYKNRLVSFSTSPANSELISKFYKKSHTRNNAELIKLNCLADFGLLRFRPKDSDREYVVFGHILCTNADCQSKPNGPMTIVFEGGHKSGAILRTEHSIELESAKVLESGFDSAFDDAWLKKIQFEKSPVYEPPKLKVRKGGTKKQHTQTHSSPTEETPEPEKNSPNASKNSTPDYLVPDPRGSKFTRSVGVTDHHRKMVGFKQVLMQLDTHCSMKSQDSYYRALIF